MSVTFPWEKAYTKDGRPFYMNHELKSTQWEHPHQNTFDDIQHFNELNQDPNKIYYQRSIHQNIGSDAASLNYLQANQTQSYEQQSFPILNPDHDVPESIDVNAYESDSSFSTNKNSTRQNIITQKSFLDSKLDHKLQNKHFDEESCENNTYDYSDSSEEVSKYAIHLNQKLCDQQSKLQSEHVQDCNYDYDQEYSDSSEEEYENIRIVIYSFNEVLTYHSVMHSVVFRKYCFNDLNYMYLMKLFGGADRICALMHHFQFLNSINIKIVIVSAIPIGCLQKILNILQFSSYIHKIISPQDDVNQYYSFSNKFRAMFVTRCSQSLINSSFIFPYIISDNNNFPLFALTNKDIRVIEKTIFNKYYQQQENHITSLSDINSKLFNDIIMDIIYKQRRSRERINISTIESVNWANKQSSTNSKYLGFIQFSEKFADTMYLEMQFPTNKNSWTLLQNVTNLINQFGVHIELKLRQAKWLSSLRHIHIPTKIYENILSIHINHAYALMEFGYHALINLKQYHLSIQLFQKLLRNHPSYNKKSMYFGLARAYQNICHYSNSDRYFRLAIQFNNNKQITIHYYYAFLLYDISQFIQCKLQCDICISYLTSIKHNEEFKQNIQSLYDKACLHI